MSLWFKLKISKLKNVNAEESVCLPDFEFRLLRKLCFINMLNLVFGMFCQLKTEM